MKKPKLKSINDGLADDVELGHCIWIDECGWCMREDLACFMEPCCECDEKETLK